MATYILKLSTENICQIVASENQVTIDSL